MTHGFTLIREGMVRELKAEAKIFRHEGTGAKLLWLPTADSNKVFAAQFATRPQDDTGVAHILEHSVLSGSEKFPLKEPFVTLLKGSLNTFLNAMTFADKTLYPFASQNDRDFMNLLEVYLDAVFFPKIKDDPQIFRQEGWHLELAPDGTPFYNGVVYNEMKGVMSQPGEIIQEAARKLLFDNVYRWNHGGLPARIPQLTYADFIAFHDRYYHPSNAVFYLYGDADFAAVTRALDTWALSRFDKRPAEPPVPRATPLKAPRYQTLTYDAQDELGFAGLQFVFGDTADAVQNMLVQVLASALFGLESSPVRRRLIDSGFCRDISLQPDATVRNTTLSLLFAGIAPDLTPEAVEATVLTALGDLDPQAMHELLDAALTGFAFMLREYETGSFPKGLAIGFDALLTWQNGVDPIQRLSFEEPLEELQRRQEAGTLLDAVRPLFIDNPHRATIVLRPGAATTNTDAAGEAARSWHSLGQAKQDALRQANRELAARQTTPDSPADLAKMPQLKLTDIQKENRFVAATEKTLDVAGEKLRLVTYEAPTSDISYIGLNFPLIGATKKDYYAISLLSDLLLNVDTKTLPADKLYNRMLSGTGGFNVSPTIDRAGDYLTVGFKVLPEQLDTALKLAKIVLTESRLADPQKLQNALMMNLMRFQMDFVASGNAYAQDRVASYINPHAKAKSLAFGIDHYAKTKQLLKQFPEVAAELAQSLQELLDRLIQRRGLLVTHIGDRAGAERLVHALDGFLCDLPVSDLPARRPEFETAVLNEAFAMPADVNYVAQGGCLAGPDGNFTIRGAHHVLANLLDKDYLWNTVRVQGGAYGAQVDIGRRGYVLLSSYRDPNIGRTLAAFRGIPDYLKELDLSEAELKNYIIGTIAAFDAPASPATEGGRAIRRLLRGTDLATLQREREEILHCTVDDLRATADAMRRVLEQNAYCVFGNPEAIAQDKTLFSEMIPLG